MTTDHYHDDPQEFSAEGSNRKSFFGNKIFGISILLGALVFGNTLAANINLNSNRGVEFGQGLASLISCAGSNPIEIIPKASFLNASQSGAFYFREAIFSNIPSNCIGSDFYLSAYGVSGAALRLAASECSNGDGNVAVIRFRGDETTGESPRHPSNSNNVYLKISDATSTGFKVTWAIGGCNPSAKTDDVQKITLQTEREKTESTFYNVGDISSSGGLIFFKTVNSPTSHTYYEIAPRGWSGTDDDPRVPWCVPFGVAQKTLPSDQNGLTLPNVVSTDSSMGSGFSNTSLMASWCKSGAAQLVKTYIGGGYQDWYLPSRTELTQLCKFTHGDTSSNLLTSCVSGQLLTGQHQFDGGDYWSSTSDCDGVSCFSSVSGLGRDTSIQDGVGYNTRYAHKYELGNSDGYQTALVRPIRSWTAISS